MKTYVIITYAGTHYLITDEQELKLRDVKSHSQFKIDGSMIMGSNIAEVMTISKYYETYPDKRPQITDRYKELPGMGMAGFIKRAPGEHLRGIISGLKNYINSIKQNPIKNKWGDKAWYQGTEAPKELLKMAEQSLNNLIQSN